MALPNQLDSQLRGGTRINTRRLELMNCTPAGAEVPEYSY